MMVIVNNTCVLGNNTDACLDPGSPAGLAAGLTLFFLLLVIIAAVVLYKYSTKIRTVVQFDQRSQKKKEDCADTGRVDPQHYTGLMREQATPQTPIYENLTALKAGHNRPAAKQHRLPAEPEEDLYLQCDSVNVGIYTNDQGHNSVLPGSQEEDVYIMPDA